MCLDISPEKPGYESIILGIVMYGAKWKLNFEFGKKHK